MRWAGAPALVVNEDRAICGDAEAAGLGRFSSAMKSQTQQRNPRQLDSPHTRAAQLVTDRVGLCDHRFNHLLPRVCAPALLNCWKLYLFFALRIEN